MDSKKPKKRVEAIKERHPEKFLPEERIFEQIRRGDRIFIGTGAENRPMMRLCRKMGLEVVRTDESGVN